MKNINISPNAGTQGSDKSTTTMTSQERRSSGALALIFALRMLGLFLVLPVFMLEARKYPGGDDPAMIGLAMGLYGLTQAEVRVALELAHGSSQKQVANAIGVAPTTVRTQAQSVYAKMRIQRHADLMRIVLSLGQVKA